MHAASRESMTELATALDNTVAQSNAAVDGAQIGPEFFDVVEVLDSNRDLRVALIDPAASSEKRADLADRVFGEKLNQASRSVLRSAVDKDWSNTRDFRNGLVQLGRWALFRAAEADDNLTTVESELFQLARVLEDTPQLEMLLADRQASADRRRQLLASVLYGKVTSITETLALQAISRAKQRPVEACETLSREAAQLRGYEVAHVVTAGELSDTQRSTLADKLGRIYGHKMSIHGEVDPSILGGMVIRVGDERIDGSTSGKLEKLRRAFA
ncbi:F0F1 ATP synthase subunit delta [Corynebacterium kroppenstedtii]|jgi:ATP synthase F1, delta subunit|uniref:ATP synthase subunit delta n=1 Tax=Corynebacterium kroppenstedtii TaxID=161879 RepID=A0A2W5UMJ6_9CORY|nr:F0F1 ATP synthase subunit delta [Corynebacterium kroppenstedtii]MDU7287802.1 F0F1 ATP synthase subunit delta [Corynebacterium kroppenstedtii]PZR04484.1 MAG: F0F1 ATP synthase subunit delta [Corynebacterium kroppenstedtii]